MVKLKYILSNYKGDFFDLDKKKLFKLENNLSKFEKNDYILILKKVSNLEFEKNKLCSNDIRILNYFPNSYVVYHNLHESGWASFNNLYEDLINQYKNRIFLLENFENTKDKLYSIQFKYFPYFFNNILNFKFKNKKRNKKFISLIRRLKFHRILLLSKLSNNFIKNNNIFYTFDVFDYNECENIINKNFNEVDFDFINIKKEELKNKIQTLYIDNPNKVLNGPHGDIFGENPEVGNYFIIKNNINYLKTCLDSYFDIVTESEFSSRTNNLFTEKIFKPIVFYQPFLVIGRPHILRELKKIGFKTFDQFWDESYDSEENDYKRFSMVNNIINDLNNKSMDDIHELYISMKEILIHNYNHLKTFTNDNLMKDLELALYKKIKELENV